jgi:hypothetical protein
MVARLADAEPDNGNLLTPNLVHPGGMLPDSFGDSNGARGIQADADQNKEGGAFWLSGLLLFRPLATITL